MRKLLSVFLLLCLLSLSMTQDSTTATATGTASTGTGSTTVSGSATVSTSGASISVNVGDTEGQVQVGLTNTESTAKCKSNPLCDMKDGLCLDTPKKADGLTVCPELEGKDICCDVSTLNSVKTTFQQYMKDLETNMGKNDDTVKASIELTVAEEEADEESTEADIAIEVEVATLIMRRNFRFLKDDKDKDKDDGKSDKDSDKDKSDKDDDGDDKKKKSGGKCKFTKDQEKKIKAKIAFVEKAQKNMKTKKEKGGGKTKVPNFVPWLNFRKKCYEKMLTEQTRFYCMACSPLAEQVKFVTIDKKIVLGEDFCDEMKNHCTRYFAGYEAYSEYLENLDGKKKITNFKKSLKDKIKALSKKLKDSCDFDDLSEECDKVIATVKELTKKTVILKKTVNNCDEKSCEYVCKDVVSNEEGIKTEVLVSPGENTSVEAEASISTDGLDFSISGSATVGGVTVGGTATASTNGSASATGTASGGTRRLLQTTSSPIYATNGYNPETSVTSGFENTVVVSEDPSGVKAVAPTSSNDDDDTNVAAIVVPIVVILVVVIVLIILFVLYKKGIICNKKKENPPAKM